MPAKKGTKKRDQNGRYTKEEVAVVSSLGVNDTPEPTTPVEKVTAHGNTITNRPLIMKASLQSIETPPM